MRCSVRSRSTIIDKMDNSFLAARSPFAISVGTGVVATGLIAIIVIAAALLVGRRGKRLRTHSRPDSWELQLLLVCGEARAVVDDLLRQQTKDELPPNAVLSAAAVRLDQLDGPLDQVVREAPSRASESAEEIGQVSHALRAELRTERARRLTIDHRYQQQPAGSNRLVMERVIELETVVQAAFGLLTEDRYR